MMGEVADETFDTLWHAENDERIILWAMQEGCPRKPGLWCGAADSNLNDDGMWQCPWCGATADIH